ncbi:hypothetical protein C8A03DRAFT_34569 [Achaetomium macrosporum]|uniref:Uncharacterized protein n=1 Tax=Achaetomium macrosporum TaxID=79813 RepID=A0AAN7H6L0_9PEZI|nr:hypothetical protein C8A03DRAFT_34569 [Achaetomium macrosporum]
MGKSIPTDALPEPPTTSVGPYPHHCQGLALQKYLLLHEQHESLRQHLDELRPSRHQSLTNSLYTPVSPNPPPERRMSLSSTEGPSSRRISISPPFKNHHPSSRPPSAAAAVRGSHHEEPAWRMAEVAVEEAKLCDVNEGMKRALTELLNCETVRGDPAFRTWVQCRLLDTERELRSGRRRRSAPGA